MVSGQAYGQLLPFAGPADPSSASETASRDPEQLRQSLDEVIATLESDERRGELLSRLKDLRGSLEAAGAEGGGADRQGLIGALAELGEQAEAGQSPVDVWGTYTRAALEDARSLFSAAGGMDTARHLIEASVLLAAWLAILGLFSWGGRLWFCRQGWPLVLPPEPGPGMLTLHLLRKLVPWAVSFGLLYAGLAAIDTDVPARAAVLVVAYAALWGRALATVFDSVIALFTVGHRRTAVAILHRRAPPRLFLIGALVAFSDVTRGDRLTELLGTALAGWLSVLASVLAGLLSAFLVIRLRRPVTHLIRNRPFRQRYHGGTARELVGVFARLWHVPALLLIGAALVAIFVTAGEAEAAFVRAVVCAVLLVVTLFAAGALRRQGERIVPGQYRARYLPRLLRFAYTVAQFLLWVVFAELSFRVWGVSLLGIGEEGAVSARIGQAVLGVGVTLLLAWLVWIFADTAIERALYGGTSPRRGRVNSLRVQTIAPMVRNVAFFTIVVIAVIVGLANLGVNVTPLLAGAGVIGLAVGFGAQTLVQDLITGLFILVEDSLSVGDFVEIGGHMGTVEGLNLRTVKLRDLDGVLHIITFSRIDSIHNMSRNFGIALLKVRVPHDLPIDDAVTLMKETAEELRKDPSMRMRIRSPLEMQGIDSFQEGCPVLRMRLWTAPEYQWEVSRAFNLLLKRRMEDKAVALGAPRLTVSMEGDSGPRYGHGTATDGGGDDAGTTVEGRGPSPDPTG